MPEPRLSQDEPLGLTVHSMPQPTEVAKHDAQRTRSGRWKMLLLVFVCVLPVIASYLSYYVFKPEGRRNYGELIDPQRPLPPLTATDLSGHPLELSTLKGQWLLISVAGGACDADCQQRLYLQRQLRETLGKHKDRLDWVWLISDGERIPEELRPAVANATVLRVPAEELAKWLAPAAGHPLSEHLYVVDPMGHWMMRFPAAMDVSGAAKAKRDLDQLMRASASWDEAGR